VAALLSRGLSPNERGLFINTAPLILALTRGQDVTDLLLAYGASPDVTDGEGESALAIAIRKGNRGALIQLIDKHANVEAEDPLGNTALMLAAAINDKTMTTILLSKGNACRTARNRAGQTAYDIARRKGFGSLTQILR
jgi:hypothetical protein